MIRNSASPARLGAGLPAPGFGPWLVAFALGLAALAVLAFATAPAGSPAGDSSVRPMLTVMSPGSPAKASAKAPVMLKLERDVTAMAADLELLADPAMPGPTVAVALPRMFAAAAFREAGACAPPSAPGGSPLRPPRTA